MKLYFAYGSNMNKEQMAWRCPDVKPVGKVNLPGWRLVFRRVADIEPASENDFVPGVVYDITPKCESALDSYEGYPSLYRKEHFVVNRTGYWEAEDVMFYKMNSDGIAMPSHYYFESIEAGYKAWGIDPSPLNAALEHAWQVSERDVARNAPSGR
jgi:gamma-glutamylcyclotransferase (GGCT)/AIG2-like uncharacterized protein YtfP